MSQKLYFNILWKLKYKLFIYQYLNICSQELGRISLKSARKNLIKEFREKLKSRLIKKKVLILGIGPILIPLYLKNGKSHANSIGILSKIPQHICSYLERILQGTHTKNTPHTKKKLNRKKNTFWHFSFSKMAKLESVKSISTYFMTWIIVFKLK